MTPFNGLGMSLGKLSRLSHAQTRSISAENPTGTKGGGAQAEPGPRSPARELGKGWKCRPCVTVEAGKTITLADIQGPGAIQSVWCSGSVVSRDFILRVYWDDQSHPSIETPLPDFFAVPWAYGRGTAQGSTPIPMVNSMPVVVAPKSGLNSFWEMPFRGRCHVTLENLHPTQHGDCFYQINYTLTDVPDECAYFHAQFRRVNPTPFGQEYVILDNVRGRGHYVGTSLGVGVHNTGWWGEGEIKFFLDGDGRHPTICGTGTEDYFGGSYNWDVQGQYVTYTTPFLGMHQVLKPDGLYQSQHRHAMYRWHVMDPVRFEKDLRVHIQMLGWRSEGRYLPGMHDVSSVAYWYQTLPSEKFPPLPDRNGLEVI
ncbi:MAG: DUF2961 domain-containing protein [Phycisphaera sp.]|nr:DUF2961 domain-containing protein [Phycisphaera sp.]